MLLRNTLIRLVLLGLSPSILANYKYQGVELNVCDKHLPNQEARIACYLEYTSITHPNNQINVPLECQDPNQVYKPIRYIYNQSGSYYDVKDAQLEQPINGENGVIQYDFSDDKYPEYIFLERKGADIKLVACISKANKHYHRMTTDFSLNELNPKTESMSAFIQGIRLANSNQLIIYNGAYEHNTGSYSTEYIYTWNSKIHNFLLDQTNYETYRGDGMDADKNIKNDYKNLRYQFIYDCSRSSADYGCTASSIETGKLKLTGPRPTLNISFKNFPFYNYEHIPLTNKPYVRKD